MRLYVDGVLRASLQASATARADVGPLYVGRDDGWARFGAAFIDEVAVYGEALSGARALAHAQASGGGGGCISIAGANGPSYSPVAADVGASLRVVVTASNGAGSASAGSAQSAPVVAG